MIATTCLAEVRQVPLQLSRYSHAKTSISAAALLMPATGLVLIFMALPLLYLLRYSFNDFVPASSWYKALLSQTLRHFYGHILSERYEHDLADGRLRYRSLRHTQPASGALDFEAEWRAQNHCSYGNHPAPVHLERCSGCRLDGGFRANGRAQFSAHENWHNFLAIGNHADADGCLHRHNSGQSSLCCPYTAKCF